MRSRIKWGFVWAVVACLSFGILSGCNSQKQTVSAAKATPTPVEAQPLFTPQAATLAQQKMCDEQAAKKYHENGFGSNKNSTDSFTSHYDPTVNVCYIRVDRLSVVNTVPVIGATVYDAFGGRMYANYSWINSQHKSAWEVPPTMCEIHIPGKPDETCKSGDEFDALTEKYFGVTQ